MKLMAILLLAFLAVGCGVRPKEGQKVRSVAASAVNTEPITSADILDHHDSYHVIVFSYINKGVRQKAVQSHTFATWVHTRNKVVVDQVDISWCPADGEMRVVSAEVLGKNKSLAETLEDARDMKLAYWVLRTDKTFFDDAARQRDRLVYYKAVDNRTRPKSVNCIHACSDVVGHLDTGAAYGIDAGQMVANFYVRKGRAWHTDEPWVIRLVLKDSPFRLP